MMWSSKCKPWLILALALTAARSALAQGDPPDATVIESMNLSKSFHTISAWRLSVFQEPRTVMDVDGLGDEQPGVIRICLQKNDADPCFPYNPGHPKIPGGEMYEEPHYLKEAKIIDQHGTEGGPFLLVKTASVYGGDGDQIIFASVYVYRKTADRFDQAYSVTTGKNNNQDIRYFEAGPLVGDIVTAVPTDDAPYGYWIGVNRYSPAGAFQEVLRFRSATRYGDGNPLSVIDSELPNIERHLGLWRVGQTLPVSVADCANPRLTRMELWCR